MDARLFYSFSTELLKIATGIKTPLDADLRELTADRRGDEKYLPGGQLPTNALEDEGATPYPLSKTADQDSGAINIASGVYDFPAKKKKKNTFQKVRDYSAAGGKGAFVGIGGLEAARKLMGQFEKPEGAVAKKMGRRFQLAAGLGASASMLERAYRYNHLPKVTSSSEKKAMIAPNAGRTLGTPARSLAASRRVGTLRAASPTPRLGGSLG